MPQDERHRIVLVMPDPVIPFRDGAEDGCGDVPGFAETWQALKDDFPDITLKTLLRSKNAESGGEDEAVGEGLERIRNATGQEGERRRISSEAPNRRHLAWRLDDIPDPSRFYFVQTEGDPRALTRALNEWDLVATAYWEGRGSEPVQPNDDDEFHLQSYLGLGPAGIGAQRAWTEPGGDGAGVGFVDLERGWEDAHPDLPHDLPRLSGTDYEWNVAVGHGTKTLGVVCGVDNAIGVVGVAPNARPIAVASWHSDDGANSVENAIFWSLLAMNRGDVLLIEVQKDGPDGVYQAMPAEATPAIHLWTSIASLLGVVVVAAAGNGGHNLDKTGNVLVDTDETDYIDSESIMVGSALLSPGSTLANPSWIRRSDSNHGQRVDCFAWGNQVRTTVGVRDPAPIHYYGWYAGTSAAAAIVAGAALSVQGMAEARHQLRYTPSALRDLLRKSGIATYSAGAGIGVMPDLDILISKLDTHPPSMDTGPAVP